MFDDVSGRYDLLNRVMTLGQDGAWRAAMGRQVPPGARVVLDLCTGSGVSALALRRPGRTVLGVDVSAAMLGVARARADAGGWEPRFACADAFRLPLPAAAVDAVTVAFGIRNLRPRAAALAEIARVLRPGGTLVVLEAAAPAPGPLAPLLRLWVRHAIPLAGRLSPDPGAYRYLSESILDFGAGEFEAALADAGFALAARQAFLFGAARLWTARRDPAGGQIPNAPAGIVQSARASSREKPQLPAATADPAAEARLWTHLQLWTAVALTAGLVWALFEWRWVGEHTPLAPVLRLGGWALLGGALVVAAVRVAFLALRVAALGGGSAPRT